DAHAPDVRQQALAIVERAVLSCGAWGAREQLIPGAEARFLRFHEHLDLASVGRRLGAVGVAPHKRGQLPVHLPARRGGRRRSRRVGVWNAQRLGELPQSRRVGGGPVRACRCLLDAASADLELDAYILTRRQALGELAAPGLEVVHPVLEREAVATELGYWELSAPAA